MSALRAALLVLTLAGPAWAHRLNVEATLEAGRVTVLVYFSDGATPEGAEVVASRDGVEVARGRTDARGTWSFAPTAAGKHLLEVTEPGLHRGKVEVEVPALAPVAAPSSATPVPATSAIRVEPPPGGVDWVGSAAGLAVIAALALGLAWWQRPSRAGPRRRREGVPE